MRIRLAAIACFSILALAACSGSSDTSSSSSAGGSGGESAATTTSATGSGGSSTAATTTSGAGGGGASATSTGSGGELEEATAIVDALKADLDGTLRAYAEESGWPVHTATGYLFVSTTPGLDSVAGDHDGWAGTPMNHEQAFSWLVLEVQDGDHYKYTDGTTYEPDAWSRAYTYDNFGEMSLVAPKTAHLDRYFFVGDAQDEDRTVRVWVPEEAFDRVLYVHDGQNLFDPDAFWGGWHLQDSVPPAMLLVGIDNTQARLDEYTHVVDKIDGGLTGGKGDAYADFLEHTVRPLIQQRYGETGPLGLMGSSLGGLIAFHVADRYPGEYAFAASLSGTMGWGSIGLTNETMIQRYAAHGHQGTALYVDSGGSGTCGDTDGDGTDDDDPTAEDNYCENAQMKSTLKAAGYVENVDLFYYWEPGAQHNEAEWAARVFRPLDVFAGL